MERYTYIVFDMVRIINFDVDIVLIFIYTPVNGGYIYRTQSNGRIVFSMVLVNVYRPTDI